MSPTAEVVDRQAGCSRYSRQVGLVPEVAALVLEDEPDHADCSKRNCDEADPVADGQAGEHQGRRGAKRDRPPAPGAEEALLRLAIVDERVYDKFLDQLKARVEKITIGDPAENTGMGAVINEGSMKTILEYILLYLILEKVDSVGRSEAGAISDCESVY